MIDTRCGFLGGKRALGYQTDVKPDWNLREPLDFDGPLARSEA